MQGRRIVYNTGFALNVISFILYFIGFSSPYWMQSWPRVHSGFKRIGLWEACFAGNVLHFDPSERSYFGCWWIFAPEYKDMRKWLMPWWFILVQLLAVLVFVSMLLNLILSLVVWVETRRKDTTGGKRRAPIISVSLSTAFVLFNAIVTAIVVILFGVAQYIDRNWMPQKQLNYLSWSYGLVICSGFFSIFACFPQIVYNKLVRQDYRTPGILTTPIAQPTYT